MTCDWRQRQLHIAQLQNVVGSAQTFDQLGREARTPDGFPADLSRGQVGVQRVQRPRRKRL